MKKQFLNFIVGICITIMITGSIALPTMAATPSPYFDLGFTNNGVYDKAGNVQVEMIGGSVGDTSVNYNETAYTAKSYTGSGDGQYIKLKLNNINSADDLKNFIFSGCSFEIFLQLANQPGGTLGLMTTLNGGGVGLGLRGADAQINFQIGTTGSTYEYGWVNYAAVAPMEYETGNHIETQKMVHLIATYDNQTNKLNLYRDGVLINSGSYGTGDFKIGSALYNELGIGVNISYLSESLGKYTEYTVVTAKLYDQCLSANQISAEFDSCVRLLTGVADTTADTTSTATTTAPKTSDMRYVIIILSCAIIAITTSVIRNKKTRKCK